MHVRSSEFLEKTSVHMTTAGQKTRQNSIVISECHWDQFFAKKMKFVTDNQKPDNKVPARGGNLPRATRQHGGTTETEQSPPASNANKPDKMNAIESVIH